MDPSFVQITSNDSIIVKENNERFYKTQDFYPNLIKTKETVCDVILQK